MESIFRTATTQAILDIISDHSSESRFGRMLTEDDTEQIAARVVDLFEMTLELRNRTGLGASKSSGATKSSGNPPPQPAQRRSWSEEEPSSPFPTTVNASEYFDRGTPSRLRTPNTPPESDDPGALDVKLPRTRKPFAERERLALLKRNLSS